MGIFYKQAKIVNRTSGKLSVRFDGQEVTLAPGENIIPEVAIPFALNQNSRNGSQDMNDPSEFVSLIGIPGSKGKFSDCSPLEQDTTELSRYNADQIAEEMDLKPGQKPQVRGRKPTAADARQGIRNNAEYQLG